MAILVTGGGGMTSKAMSSQLKDAGIPFVVGSTRGAGASSPGIDAVKFDWTDEATYPIPFQHEFPNGEKITAVYIVPGPLAGPSPAINAFVDYAMKEHGVKRFVLCGGGSVKKGGPNVGSAWSHLEEVGAEYLVLRHWRLMLGRELSGNVLPSPQEREQDLHMFWRRDSEKPFNCDFTVHGPELVTHDQLAEKFSKILGRKVEHVKLTEEQRAAMMMEAGFPAEASKFAAYLEANVWDKERDDATVRVTGKKLVTCDDFIEKHKAAWL